MNYVMTIWLLVVLAIFVAIPVLVGVYVWRDASRRGMNAPCGPWWRPGPRLHRPDHYLLVRGSWPDLRCPACGEAVNESFARCPRCGARLKAACPGCAAPVEAGWRVCPHCGTPLGGRRRM